MKLGKLKENNAMIRKNDCGLKLAECIIEENLTVNTLKGEQQLGKEFGGKNLICVS
jgi:hypothetical protein